MRKRGLGKAVEPPLRVREDWWVFEKTLKVKGGLVDFRRSLKVQGNTCSFSNVNKVLLGFRKTSLNAKEVFRKPFLSPIP